MIKGYIALLSWDQSDLILEGDLLDAIWTTKDTYEKRRST